MYGSGPIVGWNELSGVHLKLRPDITKVWLKESVLIDITKQSLSAKLQVCQVSTFQCTPPCASRPAMGLEPHIHWNNKILSVLWPLEKIHIGSLRKPILVLGKLATSNFALLIYPVLLRFLHLFYTVLKRHVSEICVMQGFGVLRNLYYFSKCMAPDPSLDKMS